MKFLKIALLGTAALAAASVSARADSLDSLKAAMDNLTIGAVADAPAAAAPATVIVWDGRVRAAIGTEYVASAVAGKQYASDIKTNFHLGVNATTQTAVGEVGVGIAIQSTNTAGFAQANGQGGDGVSPDGYAGWWKMSPTMTLKAGTLGTQKSSYSTDAMLTNWFYKKVTAIQAYGANNDPAAFGLYYADGPVGFGLQVYDSNNANNNSAFGVNAKASYKMDAIGFDISGDYAGRVQGAASWAVAGGVGYSAGAFSLGVALGTGSETWTVGGAPGAGNSTLGSIGAKVALSDVARLELGASRDFAMAGNPTWFTGGIYYTPVKQLAFGIEAGYQSSGLGAAGGDGSYSAGLVSQFSF